MKLFCALLAAFAIAFAASPAQAGNCPGGNCSLNRSYYSQPAYSYSQPVYSQPAQTYSHAAYKPVVTQAYKPVVTQSAPVATVKPATTYAKPVAYSYAQPTYYYPSSGYTRSTCSSNGYCR
jgi:hypothetical protein